MLEILPFFLVILAGLFLSGLFNRLHLPWVVALIIAGITIGPYGLGWVGENETLNFIGNIGLVFFDVYGGA